MIQKDPMDASNPAGATYQRIEGIAYQNALREAALLNKKGVSAFFLEGQLGTDLSLRVFREALLTLQALAVSNDILGIQELDLRQGLKLYTAPEMRNLSDAAFHLCNEPKVFEVSHDDVFCVTCLSTFSAAVLFNLALACHQQAVLTNMSTKCSRAAELLYEQCAQLCTNILDVNHDAKDIWVLYMSCTNNIVHIQKSLFRTTELNVSLTQLRQLAEKVGDGAANDELVQQVTLNIIMAAEERLAASIA